MSFRISSAANRPGAPMMPPPGWVADPHIYRFLIGVRNCAHPGTGRRKKNCSSDKLALKNIAFAQSPLAFQIERRHDLPVQNDVANIRRVLGNGVDHVVAKLFFLIVPIQDRAQLVRRVLHEARHYVFARRRDRWIGQRWNHHVNVRTPREVPVFGVVVSAFHVLHAGEIEIAPRRCAPGPGRHLKFGRRIERHVHLARRSAELVPIHFFQKISRQVPVSMNLVNVSRGSTLDEIDVGINFIAVGEHHALRLAALHDDLRDRCLGTNLNAGFARRIGNRI